MGRILVVEPGKIMQHALGLALFPDHEVQVTALLSDSTAAAVKEFDLVIIDSAALRESKILGAQSLRAAQGWKVPTIWIDGAGGSQAPDRDKLVILTTPIQKDTLQTAVAKCLDISSADQNGKTSTPVRGRMAAKEALTGALSQGANSQIIELVDVVEEPPESRKNKTQQRKTK